MRRSQPALNAAATPLSGRPTAAPPSFDIYLDYLLSAQTRDTVEMGCAMAAAASEVARQGPDVSARFAAGLQRMIETIEASLDDTTDADRRRRLAITAVVAEVGAISIARGVAKSDPALADEILAAARAEIGTLAPQAKSWPAAGATTGSGRGETRHAQSRPHRKRKRRIGCAEPGGEPS